MTTTFVEPLTVASHDNDWPGQEHWVIRQNLETGTRRPINANGEMAAYLSSFRDACKRAAAPAFRQILGVERDRGRDPCDLLTQVPLGRC